MGRRKRLRATLLTVSAALAGCTSEPVVCDPECAGDTPFCDPIGRCVECSMDSDCPDAAPLCASGANVCVECTVDEDCAEGFVCYDAVCELDCPLPYARTREADGGCGGCASDADCAFGECRDGFCQVPSCREAPAPDAYCFVAAFESLPSVEGRCHAPSGRCLDGLGDDDCPAGWRCYEDGCVAHCALAGCGAWTRSCGQSGRCSGCEHLGPGVDPALAPAECDPP